MPGLFGIANASPPLSQRFDRYWTGVGDTLRAERLSHPTERWEIGRVHLGTLQPQNQLSAAFDVQVLFHGDLINAGELASLVTGRAPDEDNTTSWLVGELYRRFGSDMAGRLDGSYCCVIVDRRKHLTILLSDRLGSYPLYWTTSGESLVFGSELRGLLKYWGGRCVVNPAAVGDYLTFGFLFGTKTLADGVNLVPPGSALIYHWDTKSATTRQYAALSDAFQPWDGNRRDYVDAVRGAFVAAVQNALSGKQDLALSLSGGLDSRAILSAVNGHAHSLNTYTVGVKGCADQAIAEQLARTSGTRHTFFELDESYLGDFLSNCRRMVSLTDGMYLSHGLTEIAALDVLAKNHRLSVLLRGHGGELAKTDLAWPLHTDKHVQSLETRSAFTSYLLSRIDYIRKGVEWQALFNDPWSASVREGGPRSLDSSIADLRLKPAELCAYLYLQEQHRRFTMPSLELFRHVVEVRLPFVDWTFLTVLFRGDPRWRQDTSLHREVIGSANPALLRIRNSNTGAAADAGPFAERVMDKLNSVFRRLNLSGYRHYHNFQSWMRSQLLASVESVLLSGVSLERGMLRADGVRRLLDETREGKVDHSYLLQVLLIIELWQQEVQ